MLNSRLTARYLVVVKELEGREVSPLAAILETLTDQSHKIDNCIPPPVIIPDQITSNIR